MKNILIVLTFFFTLAALADVKISQLPLTPAANTHSADSFPYVNSAIDQTDRIQLGDLPNLPSMQAAFLVIVPAQTGNANKCLQTNGTVTSWLSCITIGALDAQAENATGATFTGKTLSLQSADATHPGLVNNTTQTMSGAKTFSTSLSTPSLSISGASSGVISVLPQAAAGTYNFNLPVTAGSSGQALTSAGGVSSPMTWTSVMTNPMTTLGDLIYGLASGVPARIAGNTTAAIQFLGQTGTGSVSAAPAWASFTPPTFQRLLSTGTQTGWIFLTSPANCTQGAVYTNNSNSFTCQVTSVAATIISMSGTGATTGTTLTKSSGTGDATITFSSKGASATYTPPSSPRAPLYIKVIAVGGGGGGGGGGTTAGTAANAGKDTYFAAPAMIAGGGSAGNIAVSDNGGSGGTPVINSPATAIYFTTGNSGGGGGINTTTASTISGAPAGGCGGGGYNGGVGICAGPGATAVAATANSGAGGGGGGGSAANTCNSGPGGGAGGYAEATFATASYPFLIGTGGAGGGAGGGSPAPGAGGAGASGVVIVEEFYQ